MSIKSPATYSDWYWKNSVEATAEFDEQIEAAFAPVFRGVLAGIPFIDELPPGLQSLVRQLAEPPSAGFGGFALGAGIKVIDESFHSLLAPAMSMLRRNINKRAKETWLTSQQVNTLFRRGKIAEGLWAEVIAAEGYEDILGKFLYQAEQPYPTLPELVLYSRYHGDPANVWGEIQKYYDVDAVDWPIWEWLGLQRLDTLQLQQLYKRGSISESDLLTELYRIGWNRDIAPYIKELSYSIPNAMLLVQGDLLQNKYPEDILDDIVKADIHPEYAQKYLDAILTKPSSQDLIAYHLRTDPKLSLLSDDLKRIGIHDKYLDVYKTLAYPIPPVADIITMAVREAFTPEIATRFGQYEDYPAEFESWAAKKGLTTEWSKRYWAAHWSLPSPTQGFDMLHRGIINKDELNMLLRALDIMPFWRDKLTNIAYRLLTRVDIRRMYSVGVMNEKDVYEAYLELGYNERDSRRMSEFTVKQTIATQSKFTSGDIIKAFSKYMIDRSEARSLLQEIGVKEENISFILLTAEYKREWALTDSRITAIHNLHKKGVYDANKARAELLRLNLPTQRVDILMQEWYIEEPGDKPNYWTTAQTISFMKAGTISKSRGIKELENLGYDSEHIAAYIKGIT